MLAEAERSATLLRPHARLAALALVALAALRVRVRSRRRTACFLLRATTEPPDYLVRRRVWGAKAEEEAVVLTGAQARAPQEAEAVQADVEAT